MAKSEPTIAMQKEVRNVEENKCAQCGTPAGASAEFCESCGAPITEPAPVHTAPDAHAPANAPGAERCYQGVAIRFVQLLIDNIILAIISFILTIPFLASVVTVNTSTGAVSLGPGYYARLALGIVIALLYFTLLLGRYGQSVGMKAVKIKVVNEADSSPIGYEAAFVRTILLYIDAIPYIIPFLLGAILIWTSEKKQRLGDRVAHTVVVKT